MLRCSICVDEMIDCSSAKRLHMSTDAKNIAKYRAPSRAASLEGREHFGDIASRCRLLAFLLDAEMTTRHEVLCPGRAHGRQYMTPITQRYAFDATRAYVSRQSLVVGRREGSIATMNSTRYAHSSFRHFGRQRHTTLTRRALAGELLASRRRPRRLCIRLTLRR